MTVCVSLTTLRGWILTPLSLRVTPFSPLGTRLKIDTWQQFLPKRYTSKFPGGTFGKVLRQIPGERLSCFCLWALWSEAMTSGTVASISWPRTDSQENPREAGPHVTLFSCCSHHPSSTCASVVRDNNCIFFKTTFPAPSEGLPETESIPNDTLPRRISPEFPKLTKGIPSIPLYPPDIHSLHNARYTSNERNLFPGSTADPELHWGWGL